MADKTWYYARPGQPPAGPVSSRELKRLAADGRLTRGHFLSRTPDGRQVRADTLPGLFPPADAPAADNPFALAADPPPPPRRPDAPDDADDDRPIRTRRPAAGGGFFDLGFTRFVTPTLVTVLWGIWLLGAVPLLTLAILSGPVRVAVEGGTDDEPGARPGDDPQGWLNGRRTQPQPKPAAKWSPPTARAVLVSGGLAVAGLVGVAIQTLIVRVVLEGAVVLFRGAEAVMAIDARQRRDG